MKEAQGAAAVHNTESERAARELERTERAQPVEAEVHTETRTVPGATRETEVVGERANIPVEHNRVNQRSVEQPAAPRTTDAPAPSAP